MWHWHRKLVGLALLLAVTAAWAIGPALLDTQEQAQYWLKYGVKQAEQKKYEAAIQALNKAIDLDPRLQSAYYNLGLIYYQTGKPGEAVRHYYEALKLEPGDIQARRGLGLAYVAQKNWPRAAAVFADLLRITPDDAEAALQLGRVYLQMKQPGKALGPLQKAAELRPEDPVTHLYLAEVLTLADRLTEAEEHLLRARQLKPDSEQITRELINLYVASCRFLSAEPLAAELVAKHPDDKQLRAAQIRIYEGLGLSREKRQAQEALLGQLTRREALAVRAQLAEEYLAEARYDEALPHLKALHQARRKDSGITVMLARCYLRLGQIEQTLQVLAKALQQHPLQPELATMLGDLYVGRGELAKALDAYEQALAADRDYLEALQGACQVGARLGLTARTLPWLRRLVAVTPQDWRARMMLAEQLALAGQLGPALYQLTQVVNNSGDDELVEAASLKLMQHAYKTGNAAYEEYLQGEYNRQMVPGGPDAAADLARDDDDLRATQEQIEGLISQNPESREAKALLGEFYLETEKLDQAAAVLTEILAQEPRHAQANYLMGRVKRQQGNCAEAIAYLRSAILARPSLRAAYEVLLECAETTGLLGETSDFLTGVLADVLRSDKNVEHALHLIVSNLARIGEQAGGPEQAAAELAALSDAFPGSAELALEVARLLSSTNQAAAAGRYYERAARSPKYGHVLAEAALLQLQDHPKVALATANTYLGRVVRDEEALALIVELQASPQQLTPEQQEAGARLLSSRPRGTEYQIAKVDLRKLAGRLVEAEASLAAAVLAEPNSPALRAALAYALWLQGKPTQALTQLDQLAASAYDDPGLRTLKATILADAGAAEQALNELGQALVAQPRHSQAAMLRARLLREAGKYQEALWEICQVLTYTPGPPGAGDGVVEMVNEGQLLLPTVLSALSQAYAAARQPGVIRKLVLGLTEAGGQATVEEWLANHPRQLTGDD